MEESGLRIGTNGSLKGVNVMILNDMFASVRNIIDFTNELFNPPMHGQQEQNTFGNEQEQTIQDDDMQDEGQNSLQNIESDMDDDDDDEEDEEEEEFKLCIETKSKQRLVLCTIEGVCCAMLQNAPYFEQNSLKSDNNNDSNNLVKGNGTTH